MVQHNAGEVLKLLKQNGFHEIRVVGDHHRFTNDKGNNVTVPYNKLKQNIAPKTYNSILKQMGLK